MSRNERVKYISGASLALVPMVILAAIVGASNLIENLFVLPVLRCNPARHLPFLTASLGLRALFALHLVAVVSNIIASLIAYRRPAFSRDAPILLGLAIFGALLTVQTIQRFDVPHVVLVCFLSIALLPISANILWNRFASSRYSTSGSALAFSFVATVALAEAVVPEYFLMVRSTVLSIFRTGEQSASFVDFHGRIFSFKDRPDALVLRQLLAKLETLSQPGQRIFVGPADLRRTNCGDTYIYHLLFPKLQPASYFLEFNPGAANRVGSRLAADIATADWLVLNKKWDAWPEQNASQINGPDAPNRVVEEKFQQCGQFGSFFLFRRNSTAR